MRNLATVAAALLGLLQPSLGAAHDSREWWADDEVVGTGESCAAAYPDNPFAHLMNCWLPVFEGRSSFYIKKHDHKVRSVPRQHLCPRFEVVI